MAALVTSFFARAFVSELGASELPAASGGVETDVVGTFDLVEELKACEEGVIVLVGLEAFAPRIAELDMSRDIGGCIGVGFDFSLSCVR